MAKKKSTIKKVATAVTDTVTKAAKATAKAAGDYVVEPVGKALGLTKPKKKAKKSRTARPAKRTGGAKAAKRSGAKTAARKGAKRTAAGSR
jgi:hypothetical protein